MFLTIPNYYWYYFSNQVTGIRNGFSLSKFKRKNDCIQQIFGKCLHACKYAIGNQIHSAIFAKKIKKIKFTLQ